MGVRIKAYAKLNLTLSVTGKSQFYHSLESLVCTVDLYDLITLKRRKDGLITVKMHGMGLDFLPEEQNNAYKAAKLYQNAFSTCGADIEIFKNIPVGAGMGGSSADAAGVLRGMASLYGLGSFAQLKAIADGVGSDTGYMLTGGYAVMRGRGDIVIPVTSNTRLHFLALCPKGGVSTAECFKAYDLNPCAGGQNSTAAAGALQRGDLQALGGLLGNDLKAAAAGLNPYISAAYGELEGFAPLGVNMTGSGSCVYALFENDSFCRWAKSRYKGKFDCLQLKTVF